MEDLLREEIAGIVQEEIKDPGLGFITIIEVKMTEDLKHAKIYYSVFGSDEQKAKTEEVLKRARGFIKHSLGKRVKLKYMPDLHFTLDTEHDRAMRIEELLKKVGAESDNEPPAD